MAQNEYLHAANALVGALAVATADSLTGGAASGLTALLSGTELLKSYRAPPALQAQIAADIEHRCKNAHMTDDQRKIFLQMVQAAPLSATEIAAQARDPARIVQAMLARLTDPAHQTPIAQQRFNDIIQPLLTHWLADTNFCNTLRPAFEADVAQRLHDIQAMVAKLYGSMQQEARRHNINEGMLMQLAKNYATDAVTDFDSAFRNIENALRIYDEMRRSDALPRNAADHLDAVMQRVQALNEAARFDLARAELQQALAAQDDQIAQAQSGKARILDRMVAVAALQNAPADAVSALLERLAMDAPPDPFEALRDLFREWYHRYQSHAVPFDGQVALRLARETLIRAGNDTQRGTAQADLGNILQNLGLRAGDAAQLKAAVDAYETASTLCESRLERAIAYMNIAAALRHLGLLEDNKQTLWNAVAACHKALNVFTKNETRSYWESVQINLGNIYHSIQQLDETTSLDFEIEAAFGAVAQVREKTKSENPIGWANIQNSLGSAYSAQGHRDQDLTKLHAAAQAFSEALNFYPDSETYHWATTQSNLGATLLTIGQIERDEGALNNAAKAFRCALSKLNQQDTPKDWASTITNLANLDLAYFDLTGDAKHLAAAQTHATAPRAVYARLDAAWYLQKIDALLDEIARKST